MPISNYTTKIAASKTIGEICEMLAGFGASKIVTDYDNGMPICLKFVIESNGKTSFYELPCNAEGVQKTLIKDNAAKQYRTIEHAYRVAWRVIRDWTEAQLAFIYANQVSVAQVFLPFALAKDGRTLYDHFEDGKFKLLE